MTSGTWTWNPRELGFKLVGRWHCQTPSSKDEIQLEIRPCPEHEPLGLDFNNDFELHRGTQESSATINPSWGHSLLPANPPAGAAGFSCDWYPALRCKVSSNRCWNRCWNLRLGLFWGKYNLYTRNLKETEYHIAVHRWRFLINLTNLRWCYVKLPCSTVQHLINMLGQGEEIMRVTITWLAWTALVHTLEKTVKYERKKRPWWNAVWAYRRYIVPD